MIFLIFLRKKNAPIMNDHDDLISICMKDNVSTHVYVLRTASYQFNFFALRTALYQSEIFVLRTAYPIPHTIYHPHALYVPMQETHSNCYSASVSKNFFHKKIHSWKYGNQKHIFVISDQYSCIGLDELMRNEGSFVQIGCEMTKLWPFLCHRYQAINQYMTSSPRRWRHRRHWSAVGDVNFTRSLSLFIQQ